MNWPTLILALVALERLAELWIARRNTAALMQRGAVEHSASHYPAIVALHAAWLMGLFALTLNVSVSIPWLIFFCGLQAGRIWVLTTLGSRWTTRIIVLPGAPLVRSGPYRFVSHPNYAVVVAEIAVLPMVFGLPYYALLFSVLNAAILYVRIKAENTALSRQT